MKQGQLLTSQANDFFYFILQIKGSHWRVLAWKQGEQI